MDTNPPWVTPPDNAYAPFFEEFQSNQAPNFTAVEDLIFCKENAKVSEDPIVGIDQSVKTFWGKIFESFVSLSLTESANGIFYKRTRKSMRDHLIWTIQPSIEV